MQGRIRPHLHEESVHSEVRAGAEQRARTIENRNLIHPEQALRDRQAIARGPRCAMGLNRAASGILFWIS